MQAYLHLYLLCYSAPLQKSMKVNKEYVLQVESILLLLSIKPHQYSSQSNLGRSFMWLAFRYTVEIEMWKNKKPCGQIAWLKRDEEAWVGEWDETKRKENASGTEG